MIRRVSKPVSTAIIASLLCVGTAIVCLGQNGSKGVKNKQLEQIGIGMHEYHMKFNSFPAAGSLAGGGMLFPAWQVELLPFIEQSGLYTRIDRKQSWDSEANKPVFSTAVPTYLGDYEKQKKGADGLALSHYVGNDHLFWPREGVPMRFCTDGTSNILAVGEVGSDFSPWGRPGNTRNPANGLNGKSGQFGRKDGKGALFVLCDGTVRSISSKIDPKLLAALTTIDGYEDIEKLQGEASNAAAPGGSKERKNSKKETKDHDPKEFGRVYRLYRRQPFELVEPAEFRDLMLKTAFDTRKDPNRKMIDQRIKKRDWFEFSEKIVELANKNIDQKRPLFAPANSGKGIDDSKYFCMFVEEQLTVPDPDFRLSTFKLIKTSYEWDLIDLIEPFYEKWSSDLLRVNTPDGKLPKLELKGDIVIRVVRPISVGGLSGVGTIDINALMAGLEDYCAPRPKPLQKLRFRFDGNRLMEVYTE